MSKPTTVRRKTYIIDTFNELPEELQSRVLKSGITQEDAEKNFEALLNILHFKTKQNFYTHKMFENKGKIRVRRHNKGHSLVSNLIVSVNPLNQEAEELLSDCQKKHFALARQLGKGGFGRVYLATSERDGDKQVAIKRMPHDTLKQKRKNFQEIRFLMYLKNHPNILQYYRASLIRDEIWLVTEFLDGGTLTQAVSCHEFKEPEIAYIGVEMLNALAFLHAHQLAHRDLKSANIMLDMTGGVKLIDFGLCSDISQGEVVHMVGSPFWMPPEMILRKPHGLMVDIWSFGICVMEMANGHPPNRKSVQNSVGVDTALKAMFVAATSGYPEPLEEGHWSGEFKDFLVRCVQLNPSNRSDVPTLQKHPFLRKAFTRNDMAVLCNSLFPKDSALDVDSSS